MECCSALRPRYKRLVNHIYPANSSQGYDKSNIEKLTFYAKAKSEKLDRIGEYLAQCITRDLSRHRWSHVAIGVEAMDRLLSNSNAQSLNLFVESYLRVVQQLVESQELQMQLLGTQSFVKFANIEEDTPSYHRRYDFFVSKFASMSHNSDQDLRMAGLNGLKGVIRKTVSDDLQANIWDETHMDKIVPSLLYNMQMDSQICLTTNDIAETTFGDESAENCLKELIRRAKFGHINLVVRPVLKHLDSHDLWQNQFSSRIFKLIMSSVPKQHSYAVIQILMDHLDNAMRSDQQIKIGIVNVLSCIIATAAAESIGPSVLEIINSLLKHLRTSIDAREIEFQERIMDTLAEFSSNLPDYQKTEILFFIKSRAPTLEPDSKSAFKLQKIIHDLRGSGPESHFKTRYDSRSDNISVDLGSITSSNVDEVSQDDRITFELFKKGLSETLENPEDRRNRIIKFFMTVPVEELVVNMKLVH